MYNNYLVSSLLAESRDACTSHFHDDKPFICRQVSPLRSHYAHLPAARSKFPLWHFPLPEDEVIAAHADCPKCDFEDRAASRHEREVHEEKCHDSFYDNIPSLPAMKIPPAKAWDPAFMAAKYPLSVPTLHAGFSRTKITASAPALPKFVPIVPRINPITDDLMTFIQQHPQLPEVSVQLLLAAANACEDPIQAHGLVQSIPNMFKNWATAGFNFTSLTTEIRNAIHNFSAFSVSVLKPLTFAVFFALMCIAATYVNGPTIMLIGATIGIVVAYFFGDTFMHLGTQIMHLISDINDKFHYRHLTNQVAARSLHRLRMHNHSYFSPASSEGSDDELDDTLEPQDSPIRPEVFQVPWEMDDLEIEPQAGDFSDRLGTVLGRLFDFNLLAHMRTLSIGVSCIRSCNDIARWTYALIPAFVQGWLCKTFPKLTDQIVYAGTGWGHIQDDIERGHKRLLDSDVTEGELVIMLDAAKGYERTAARFLQLAWSSKASESVAKYRNVILATSARLNFNITGTRPPIFWFAGPPQIGKTETVRTISRMVAASIAGKIADHLVYERVAGVFAEKLETHHRVVCMNELFGTDHDTSIANMQDIMAIADGNWAPQRAAIPDKGVTYNIAACLGASNQVYVEKLPTFNNTAALHARRTLVIICTIDPEMICQYAGNTTTLGSLLPDQQKVVIKSLPDEMKAKRKFLSYRFANPTEPAALTAAGWTEERYPCYLPAVVEEACALPDWKVRFGDAPVTSRSKFTFEQVAYFCMHLTYVSTKACAPLQLSDTDMQLCSNFRPKQYCASAELPNFKALDVPSQKTVLAFKALVATTCTVGALAGFLGVYKLCRTYWTDKPVEAHYAARPRALQNIKHRQPNAPIIVAHDNPAAAQNFFDALRRNVVKVSAGTNTINGLLIDGQHLMTNYHLFMFDRNIKISVFIDDKEVIVLDRAEDSRIRRMTPTGDLAILRLAAPIPCITKIRGYFTNKTINVGDSIFRYDGRTLETSRLGGSVSGVRYDNPVFANIRNVTANTYTTAAAPGDCGSIIAANIDGSPRIIGIHCGAYKRQVNNGFFLTLTQEFLDTIWNAPPNYGTTADGITIEPHAEPIVEGNFSVVGRPAFNVGAPSGTKIKHTVFHGAFDEYPCRMGVSVKKFSTLVRAENDYGKQRPVMAEVELNFGKELALHYLDIHSNVPRGEYALQEILDVDLSTACGYGWPGIKRTDLILKGSNGTRFMDPRLQKAYDALQAKYDAGEIPPAIYVPVIKDEILPEAKIIDEKSRTFQVDQLEHYLLGRKYIGALCDHVTATHMDSPIRIGLVLPSREFHVIMEHSLGHMGSDRQVIDVDYSGFDRSHQRYLFQAVADVADLWYNNVSPQRTAWILSNCFPIEVARRTAWRRYQGMPSGMYGTAVVNSIINIIYIGAAFKHIHPTGSVQDFIDHIRMNIYGDDNQVFPDAAAKAVGFNFITIRDYLATLGITITPANKHAAPEPFLELRNSSFLKKYILWSDTLMGFVPFCKPQTIFDHISYCRDSSDEGVLQLCNAMLREYFPRGNSTEGDGDIPMDTPTFEEVRKMIASVYGTDRGLVTFRQLIGEYNNYQTPDDDSIVVISEDDCVIEAHNGEMSGREYHILAAIHSKLSSAYWRESVVARLVVQNIQDFALESAHEHWNLVPPANEIAHASLSYLLGEFRISMMTFPFSPILPILLEHMGVLRDLIICSGEESHTIAAHSGDTIITAHGNIQTSVANIYGDGNTMTPSQEAKVAVDAAYSPGSLGGGGGKSGPSQSRVPTGGNSLSGGLSVGTNGISGNLGGTFDLGSLMSPAAKQSPLIPNRVVGPGGIIDDNPYRQYERRDNPFDSNPDGHAVDMATADQPTNWMDAVSTNNGALIHTGMDGRTWGTRLGDRVADDTVGHPSDFMSDVDEMALAYFSRKWAVISTNEVSYSASGETLLFSINMTPFQRLSGAHIGDSFYMTPTEFASSLFKFWRGGLQWKFQLFGPAPISGRIAICTSYADFGLDPGYIKSVTGPTVMWDYAEGNREIVVETPYIAPYLWLQTPYAAQMTGTNYPLPRSSLGTIRVYLSSKITVPNTVFTPGPSIIVSMRGSETFQHDVFAPCTNLSLIPPVVPPLEIEAHSGTTVHEASPKHHAVSRKKAGQENMAVPIKLQQFASKWATKANYTITGATSGLIFDYSHPNDTLIAQADFAQSAMKFFKGDLEISVFPRGNGWQGGAGYLTFRPFAFASTQIALNSQLPGVWVDFSRPEPVAFTVPFCSMEEFFYAGCPNVGHLYLQLVTPLQLPASGGTSIDLEVQLRWLNFTSYVPAEIGDIVATAHAASTAAEPESLQLVSQESPPAVSPIHSTLHRLPTSTPYSLRELLKRPRPAQTRTVLLNANEWSFYDLSPYNDPVYNNNALRFFCERIYAMSRGDTVFDVVYRAPTGTNVHCYAFSTNAAPYGFDPSFQGASVFLPVAPSTTVWPSSYGLLAPPEGNPTINALPATTSLAPGHLRIIEPFRNQQRAGPTLINNTANLVNVKSQNNTYLGFFSETDASVDFTVWTQIGDSLSYGIFTGVPVTFVDSLTTGPPLTRRQMPDTYFPGV